MVLYFSGTGNSQFAAMQIAELIDDNEVVSINYYLKKRKNITFRSNRSLVFVLPTYSWRIPKVVEQWIMANQFEGNQDVYFVLTCGSNCGNAAVYVQKLCEKKGMRFRGLTSVVMPENYLALFPTPDKVKSKAIVEQSVSHIALFARKIREGKAFDVLPVSLIEKLESGPVNPLFYTLFVHDRGFKVSESCISCGKCKLRCPLNNVKLVNGKPLWNGNCTHCMACIGGCPTQAIEYKSNSKGRHRHYIMNNSLCWKVEETKQ